MRKQKNWKNLKEAQWVKGRERHGELIFSEIIACGKNSKN